MIDSGRRGAIVNMTSDAGKRGHSETMLADNASKAVVINLKCVCPGNVSTPMLENVARKFSGMTGQDEGSIFDSMISRQLERHVQPAEVAAVMAFLLGDGA